MFEDSGFEIYGGMGVDYLTKGLYEEIGAPSRRKLEEIPLFSTNYY